jgi:EAL domain-containing protein (putative c-di-GMP-specific phosphodiesterase class I)
LDDEMRARERLERDLVHALNNGEICPYYQAQVNLSRGSICGFEALAHGHHPQHGFVPPDTFIPIVEQLGLMTTLTTSILRQVCQDARH